MRGLEAPYCHYEGQRSRVTGIAIKKTRRPDLKIGAPRLLLRGEESYGFGSVPGCVFALCFLR